MLDIATPDLTRHEWADVRAALAELPVYTCGEPAAPGSVRGRIGHAMDWLAGREHRVPAPLSPRQQALRDFLCESGRTRRIAEERAATLGTHGFTRAQIEAMALIGA